MSKIKKNNNTPSTGRKKKEENSSSSETSYDESEISEGSLSESSEEEEIIVRKSKKKIQSPDTEEMERKRASPSKKSGKKKSLAALIEKGRKIPIPNEKGKNVNIPPEKPLNTIWVVKTEKLEKPFIDPNLLINLEPRLLVADEIAWIVDVVPLVPAAVEEVGAIVQQQIKNLLTTQLSREKIIPLGIGILRAEIEYHFYKGLVEPGKTIGITSSEAIAGPLTQMALNAFHQAGSASAGVSDVNALGEMFNVSPERKNGYTIIHFKNKYLTYDDVLAMRSNISSVSLHDLVKATANIPIVSEVPPHARGWWYSMAEKMYDIDMGEDSTFVQGKVYLRLVLDKQKLYSLDITLSEVAKMIIGKDSIEVCTCIVSPTSVGIIDIYPTKNVGSLLRNIFNKNRVKQSAYRALTEESMEVLFLQSCIINKMNEIIIRGIPGLRDILPVPVRIIILLKHAEKISTHTEYEGGRLNHGFYYMMGEEDKKILEEGMKKQKLKNNPDHLWKIWIDEIQLRVSGVPIERIVKFIEYFGYKVVYSPPDIEEEVYRNRKIVNPIYSKLQPDGIIIYYEGKEDPLKIMRNSLNKARDTSNKDEKSKKMVEMSEYIHAKANGINMEALLYNPYIDPGRSRCNNYHNMMETYGIEVTRNAYIREFYEHIINNGQQLNPRHLTLIAEFVTNQGFLSPITSRGVSRQNIGPFAKAAFEQAFLTFVDAAFFRKKENVKSTSTSIFTGRRAPIGTGIYQPIPDEEMLKENKILEDERFRKIAEPVVDNINLDDIKDVDFARSTELDNGVDGPEAGEDIFLGSKGVITSINKPETKEFPIWEKGIVPDLVLNQDQLPKFIEDICNGIKPEKPAKTKKVRVIITSDQD